VTRLGHCAKHHRRRPCPPQNVRLFWPYPPGTRRRDRKSCSLQAGPKRSEGRLTTPYSEPGREISSLLPH
jgi:hypothetical protein